MTLDFGQFSMEDLIAFRNALDTYISARQYEQTAIELKRVDERIGDIEVLLGTISQTMTTRQTELEALKKRLGLTPSSNGDNKPASLPVDQAEEAQPGVRNRTYMARTLNVHQTTLSRWITKLAAPYVSDACREGGVDAELTERDEAVLKRIKELREQELDTTQIKQRLNDEYSNPDNRD